MCSDPLDPDGEVRGCSVGCTITMSDVSPFVRIQLGVFINEKMLFDAGVFGMRRGYFVF